MEPWWDMWLLLGAIVLGPTILIIVLFTGTMLIGWAYEELRTAFMTEEQKAAFIQKRKEKAAKDAAGLAAVRQIEAESRMRKYQCPVCGYSSADNEFLDLYGKSTGECRCRRCGKRFYC